MFGLKTKHNPTAAPLRIIIVGCGKVGVTLVEQLANEGNDLTLIDKNPEKISEITNVYDVMGIVGNGASYSVQKEAGIDDTDLLIAVTESDELNLLCCTIAKQVADCAAIARVRTPDYSSEINYLREKLGLAMIINPEYESAMEIARILYLPSALEVNPFAHGEAELIKFKVPEHSHIVGQSVMDFSRSSKQRMLFCAVERKDDVIIPNGSFVFDAGDVVSFVAPRKYGRQCFKALGIETHQVHDCMIVGGGKASYYLGRQLIGAGIHVKIIEWNKNRCEELSLLLPEAVIINGDGTDSELLKEEGIENIDSFVPLTGMDEENILLTLHAKDVAPDTKVITKVNRFSFLNVMSHLDLGSVVFPRLITSEAIIAYARAKRASLDSNIETLYHMFEDRAEAIEFRVDKSSELTGKPISQLSLKDHLMITFISRHGEIIFPSGNDTIEVGDTVLIVTTHTGFNDISDILA